MKDTDQIAVYGDIYPPEVECSLFKCIWNSLQDRPHAGLSWRQNTSPWNQEDKKYKLSDHNALKMEINHKLKEEYSNT